MIKKLLAQQLEKAIKEKRRIVAPLAGFPGLNMTDCTVKLAQQNYGEHFKVLKAIAEMFKPDAIFPLMDLSVEANALGRFTVFPKEKSATVVKDSFTIDDLYTAEQINILYDNRIIGYAETVKLMCIGLDPAILKGAYVTGPYTLAALLMGAEEAAIASVIRQNELHEICQFTTSKVQKYIQLLITSGAQIICILEPSAVMLGPEQFVKFSAKYVSFLCECFSHTDAAIIYHICGNTMHLVERMSESGVDALSLDSPETGVDLPEAAKKVADKVIVIGNISPIGSMINGTPEDVERDVNALLKSMEPYPNFILSTGCDLPQETPLKNIEAFMQAARNYNIN